MEHDFETVCNMVWFLSSVVDEEQVINGCLVQSPWDAGPPAGVLVDGVHMECIEAIKFLMGVVV